MLKGLNSIAYVAVFLSAATPVKAFDIVSGITTGVAFQGIMGELNASINQAFSQGNYLAWNAGVQARLVLDRWGEVNKDLMNKAFEGLSDQQRQLFRNTNDLVQELGQKGDALTAKAQQLLDQSQQIVSDIKFWDGEPVLLRYAPSLINSERQTRKIIAVRGLSLNKANPKLTLTIDGTAVEVPRVSLTQSEAQFEIPLKALSASDNESKRIIGEVQLTHRKAKYLGIFGSEEIKITSPVNIGLLPKYVGELTSIETFKKTTGKVHTDWKSREFHFSSGSLDEKCDVQTQNPAQEHLIDTDTLQVWHNRPNPHPMAGKKVGFFPIPATLPGAWGKAGSARVENNTPHGFAIRVCAKRWTCCFPPDTGPGYQHIVYRWREYKNVDDVQKQQHPGGKIHWNKDNLVRVTPGTDGLIAQVKLFTGEERVEIRERLGTGRYYALEFEPKTGAILIRPQIPTELAAITN